MSFYARMAATARKLLISRGQPIVFTRTAATFDPATGTNSSPVVTQLTGCGVALDYRLDEIDGTAIQMGDVKVLLEPVAGAPAIGDTATINGRAMRVMNVSPLQPAGEVVLYELQLRS
jgi:hypothetical protein